MVYATQKDNISIEHELNIHPSFIKSTYTVYKRQLLRLVSSKMQIIFMLLMPILFLAVIGQAFKNFLPNGVQGMDYLTFMTPGVLIMVTLFSGIFGGISLFYDRDSGYLKKLFNSSQSKNCNCYRVCFRHWYKSCNSSCGIAWISCFIRSKIEFNHL